MKLTNKYFPYPIISNNHNDYSGSTFACDMQVSRNINALDFTFNIVIDDNKICSMLEDGKVEYVFHFECVETTYRDIICSNQSSVTKSILENKLKGNVSICVLLVAKEDIKDYTNENFNSDYDGFSFDIKRGTIIGIGGEFEVPIHKDTEEFEKIPSIFIIAKDSSTETDGMKIELSGDKIKIFLNESDFGMYASYINSPEATKIVGCILILPALIYTFDYIKRVSSDSDGDFVSSRWYQAIEFALKKKGVELNNDLLGRMESYELAQKLLDLPIGRAFQSISTLTTCVEDEE